MVLKASASRGLSVLDQCKAHGKGSQGWEMGLGWSLSGLLRWREAKATHQRRKHLANDELCHEGFVAMDASNLPGRLGRL